MPRETVLPENQILNQFLDYMSGIRGRSPLTLKEYRYDLTLFLRYYLRLKRLVDTSLPFRETPIDAADRELLAQIQLSDLYGFIGWLSREKKASAATRSRKIASLRSFFKYLHSKAHLISENPAIDLESPKQVKRQPRYLELEESKALLHATAQRPNEELSARDYCILTLFLNCGMRLAELCGINLEDIHEDSLRVLGKGGKERTVYLNGACLRALSNYMDERPTKNLKDPSALFISRQGNRLSRQAVQLLVKNALKRAGLDSRQYSTHKLRHTAATLLYKYGQVDIRLLQQILGHASVSTTEIYTHLDSASLHSAIEKNPLADESADSTTPEGGDE